MATAGGAHDGGRVPLPFVASYWAPLPASAGVLGLCRGGFWSIRTLGRRVDDLGACAALPALGDIGPRFCPPRAASRCAMVAALALRHLARDQCRAARR